MSYGVPLDHVAEKLGSAIEELHRFGQDHADDRAGLLPAMHYALVAHLGLHNMQGKAGDRTLASRLLNGSSKELYAWLQVISREGDVGSLSAPISGAGHLTSPGFRPHPRGSIFVRRRHATAARQERPAAGGDPEDCGSGWREKFLG